VKKLLLSGIAALFLATGAAHARDEEQTWWPDCRHGWITKHFTAEDAPLADPLFEFPPVHIMGTSVRITHDELRKLLKDLPKMMPVLKACWAFRKCQEDRDAGKVKHCYANDRRWREYFANDW
jgi:hypothetical protein